MVHLSGNGYGQASSVLYKGKKAVHFGMHHSEGDGLKWEREEASQRRRLSSTERGASSSGLREAQERSQTTPKKAEKKDLPFPTESSFFKRAANRVIQFFKDIYHAFAHLFSRRSAREEVTRSAEEFFGRPEVRTIGDFVNRHQQQGFKKAEEGIQRAKKEGYDMAYEEASLVRDKKEFEENNPFSTAGPSKVIQGILDEIATNYDEFLKEQEAEAKEKASGNQSSSRREEY